MRAIVVERFGGPEVLVERNIPIPEPAAGQIRVKIHAAGTNPVDPWNRNDGSWAHLTAPIVLGYEASGTVDALGEGVGSFQLGDEVMIFLDVIGTPMGTYAEYAVTDEKFAVRKPGSLTHIEAAALPLAGSTAYAAIVDRLDLHPDQSILIHGASGGVGLFAVQLAVARRARVIASASGPRHALLYELGAVACIDYRKTDPISETAQIADPGIDAVLDLVGGDLLARSLSLLRPYGRAASIVSLEGDLEPAIDKNITIHGILVHPSRRVLSALADLVDERKLRPIVDAILPLAEARKAHERLESGHGQGKVVLRVV